MSNHRHPWKTTAYLQYHGDVGFALPLIKREASDPKFYVQTVDQYTGLLEGFSELAEFVDDAEQIQNGPTPELGGELIYVFVSGQHHICAGTVSQIKPHLIDFAARNPERTSICLQIMELIGAGEELRSARLSMRSNIQETAGESAAQAFFEGSTATSSLWSKLIAAAPGRDAARRILDNRSRLSVQFDGGQISLDLSAVDPGDYVGTTYEKLIEELAIEFSLGGETDNAVLPRDRILPEDEPDIDSILKGIDRTGRQEERLAKLVRHLLIDENTGREVLKRYSERRGKLAAYGLNRLRELRWQDSAARDLYMSRFVENVYYNCHSMSRGALLFYMANQLAEFDSIRKVISRIYKGSGSIYVHDWGSSIERVLALSEAGVGTATTHESAN